MILSDSEIIQNIKNGNDRKVIDSLYKEVFPNVRGYIRSKKGVVQEAEDCFQEAITKFYRQVLNDQFDHKYKIHGYIYSISIRLWINVVKRDNRKVYLEDIEQELADVDERIEKNDAVIENSPIIQTLLDRIGEKCKQLLYYTIFSDLVNEDIMHRFNYSSIAAVKMQHKRCKQKLLELLKNEPDLVVGLKSIPS